MPYLYFYLIFVLCNVFQVSYQQRCEVFPRVPLGVTDRYNGIPDDKLSASSSLNSQTEAKYGRLHYSEGHLFFRDRDGAGAWIAANQDTNQWIQVDLGERYVVTGIATQGRKGAREYVQDYFILYADDDDAKNFLYLKDEYGSPFLLLGNTNDSGVVEHQFKHPLIARFVRINPQRWHLLISLRFELYGCQLESYIANFDGKSRIETFFPRGVQTINDTIQFRFRTRESEGLIMYGSSTQDDTLVIELYGSKLRISINLGDIVGGEKKSSNIIEAGSLLDDNLWHDVFIERNERMFNVSVDRMKVWQELNTEFLHLNLNDRFYLGGLDVFTNKRGIASSTNFTGCIENLFMNRLNIVRDARSEPNSSNAITGFSIFGGVGSSCVLGNSFGTEEILTYSSDAYIKVKRLGGPNFQAGISFRTYQKGTNLIYHPFFAQPGSGEQYLAIDIDISGVIKLDIMMEDVNAADVRILYANPKNSDNHYADGLWHKIDMQIGGNQIIFNIDGLKYTTVQKLNLNFREDTYIGWCPGRLEKMLNVKFAGFKGCVKSISVQSTPVVWKNLELNEKFGKIDNGSCTMRDHCMPNPCRRGAKCHQTWNKFTCDCDVGYKDSVVCHQSSYFTSCAEVKLLYHVVGQKNVSIDLDGSQVLDPLHVTCNFMDAGRIRTIVRHNSKTPMLVDGYEAPGSFRHTFQYAASIEAMTELVRRSDVCRQEISYRCKNARLLMQPTQGGTHLGNRAYGWWVSRRGQPRFYWGGSAPGHQRCACGVAGNCQRLATCNCDSFGDGETSGNNFLTDSGFLTYKEDLPVKEVRFGDTGSTADNKEGLFDVGPLECDSNNDFENTITFRKPDAVLKVTGIFSETEFDLRFMFRTTQKDAVFFQNVDDNYGTFIEVRLKRGREVQFSFNVGYGVRSLSSLVNDGTTGMARTSIIYNDNNWHIVQIERNRQEYTLKVDQETMLKENEPQDQAFRFLRFQTDLYIGATVTSNEGYVGCLSNFMVNGVVMQLKQQVNELLRANNNTLYGISAGCNPRCDTNPCLNRGECVEYYSHYYCECGMTPFRGYICGREVGVSFKGVDQIRVNISEPQSADNGGLTTIDEFIQIGFKTIEKKGGILMQIRSDPNIPDPPGGPKESIIVLVNNNGGITVEISLGFEWQEVTSSGVNVANDQHHTLQVFRTKNGRQVNIKIDDYPVEFRDFTEILSEDSDTRLDNPAVIYIGKNDSTTHTGFQGCIYRAQFNNIFPIKAAFREPADPRVKKTPGLRENYCGIEEVQPVEDLVERREFDRIPDDLNFGKRAGEELHPSIMAIIVFVCVLVVIALLAACFFRHYEFERGDYDTNEAKGADLTDDPDLAIKFAQTGQPEVRGKEWWL